MALTIQRVWLLFSKSKLSISRGLCQAHRTYLSEAFKCKEVWEKRLQSPILQKINLDDLYYELDRKLQAEHRVSAIDIDIFANAITSEVHMEELEELVHRFRLTAETRHTLLSTPHAVIRAFLEFGLWDSLVKMLSDPLNYGLFPDDYCNILLMDTFLEKKDYEKAARVATLMMLQEDFGSEISKKLALLSCFHYVKDPRCWTINTEEAPPDDSEEVKVRVRYLRNPYFDDHFDLQDPSLLVGKTLALLGREEGGSLGRTAELMGWAMYKKWERAKSTLQNIRAEKEKVLSEGVASFKEHLSEDCDIRDELCSLVNELESSGQIEEGNLIETATEQAKAAVAKHEEGVIANQTQQLHSWEVDRQDLLQQQIEVAKRYTVSEEIKRKKEQLAQKEEIIFFFENKEKIALRYPEPKFYRKKWFGKKKKPRVTTDDTYIPPDVRQALK